MAPLPQLIESEKIVASASSLSDITISTSVLAVAIFPILILALCLCCGKKKKDDEGVVATKISDGIDQTTQLRAKSGVSGTADAQLFSDASPLVGDDLQRENVFKKDKMLGDQKKTGDTTSRRQQVANAGDDALHGEGSEGTCSGLSPPPDMRFDHCNKSISSATYSKVGLEQRPKGSYRKLEQSSEKAKTSNENKTKPEKIKTTIASEMAKPASVMDKSKFVSNKTSGQTPAQNSPTNSKRLANAAAAGVSSLNVNVVKKSTPQLSRDGMKRTSPLKKAARPRKEVQLKTARLIQQGSRDSTGTIPKIVETKRLAQSKSGSKSKSRSLKDG